MSDLHILQQIRAAAAAALANMDLGDQPVSVFLGRRQSYDLRELPAVNLRSIDEEVERLTMNRNPAMQRNGVLTLEISAVSTDDVEQTLFAVQVLVEQRLAADPSLGGLLQALWLESSRQDEIEGEDVDYTTERRTLGFRFLTVTRQQAPATAV